MTLRATIIQLLEESDLQLYEIQKRFTSKQRGEVESLVAQMLLDGTLEANGNKLTLSRAVRTELGRERSRERNGRGICAWCGEPFKPVSTAKYCSKLCRHKAKWRRVLARRAA